jgi:hypothetical protein
MTAFYIISVVVCVGFAVVFYMSATTGRSSRAPTARRSGNAHGTSLDSSMVSSHEIAFIESPDHDELVNGRQS